MGKLKNADKKRHVWLHLFLRKLVSGLFCRWFHYSFEPVERVRSPFILLANHNTDLDPVLISIAFPQQMYFVASEHIFRKGFWSRVLLYISAPIPRMKGSTDAAAALEVIRRVRAGDNVCLFAEGNRSYTGVTGPVFPATGKLAKASGATLYTYRFEGGYLTTPRWGKSIRRGKMTGRVANVYTPEQLAGMSADEVNEAIARDLYEDAFTTQERLHIAYRGKDRAEYLETALYACPVCKKLNTMKSCGDEFTCTNCGFTVAFDEQGFFTGKNVPFKTVRDWDAWQNEHVRAFAESLGDETAYADEDVELQAVGENHSVEQVACGRMTMSKRELRIGRAAFLLSEISGMGLFGKAKIAFTDAVGKHYEIRFPVARCGRKYFTLYELLRNKTGARA